MRKLTAAFCASVSVLCFAGYASAQTTSSRTEPPASEPGATDDAGTIAPSNEIIVSARRRDESVQEVPQTVNVVTAEQVEKLNLRNFTDIAAVVPGLTMQSAGAFSNTATVRGVDFIPQASGNNPSVEFYLNDAPISSAFLFQTTFDFGQFELQRGPQGTLRGRASPSGSIAVTTRRPDLSEVGVVLNGTITDSHARKLDGAFNIPIIADMLAVRLAGAIDNNRVNEVHSLSESTNPQFSKGPYSRTKAIRGSIRFEPTDWLQFNAMYQDLHSERHTYDQVMSESLINPAPPAGTPGAALIKPFDRRGIDDQGSYNRQDQQVFVGNADVHFSGQQLSYVGAFSKQDFGILAPQDAANFFTPPRINLAQRAPGDPAGFEPVCQSEASRQFAILTNGAYNQCTHSRIKRESHELRLSSEERIADIFDYVVGGFYDHNDTPSNLTQETPVLLAPPNLVTPSPINILANPVRTAILRRGESTEKSVFGNITAHLLEDRLELSGGLRYIDYENISPPTLQSSATGPVPCDNFAPLRCVALGQDQSFDANATVYLASVKYKINDDINVYALTGSSWRPGPRAVGNFSAGPNRQGQTAREQDFTNLPPERSESYEIGAKTTFMDGRGRFNISAYHQKFKNYPFFGPGVFYLSTNATTGAVTVAAANNPTGFGFLSPVPVEVNGIEGELSYQILDRWSVGLNASFADGKIKNGTIACTDLNGDGVPDVNVAQPSVAALQAAVGAGQTMSQCSGINRRSTSTPKFSANAETEYAFDIATNMDGFVRGLYSFYGKTSANPDNPFDDVGAYGLLNMYAGIRDKDGNWEITAFAKNLFEEKEILTVANARPQTNFQILATGSSYVTPDYRGISVTAPREFGITARIAFGSR